MFSTAPGSRTPSSLPPSVSGQPELSDSNVLSDLVKRRYGESVRTSLESTENSSFDKKPDNPDSSRATTLFRSESEIVEASSEVDQTQLRSDCQPVNDKTVIQSPLSEAKASASPLPPSELASVPLAADQAIPGVEIVSDNLGPKFQLGNYTLIESIGGGGMGRVFRAQDNNLERDVALKVLPPKQCTDKDFRDRFIVEAKAAARLHHDNIVCVYSFGEINGLTYLSMEYIPGINIRDLVDRDGPLLVEDVLAYAIQLASALEHINQKKIVHRDIKPSNVLVTDDGTVKVIDLGLAKATLIQAPADELTATGVTLGTFDYISPEQARDPRLVDIRSDIYSLGCSLFFMLSGHPPYPKGTALQKLLRHQGEAPPNIQDFRPDVPDRLAGIITRCMAKEADARYQTPQALSNALYLAAEDLGMRPVGMSLTRWYMPSISKLRVWKERFWWLLPISGLILCVMCLDSLWKPDLHESEYLPENMSLYPETRGTESPTDSTGLFHDLKIPTFPEDLAPPAQ